MKRHKILIIIDANVDVKDCRRAMLDYCKEHKIEFTKIDACEDTNCEHWKVSKPQASELPSESSAFEKSIKNSDDLIKRKYVEHEPKL